MQQLNHPNIPRYLDSFETSTGFCLVQEYKNAPCLAQPRHWTPEEIQQIAVAVLKVLIYLQQEVPPIIHRDIKPENILVDRKEEISVYLVDFGLAHVGSGEVAVSSVVKGTLGFMPPEQLFNRQLTEASDLYSLGATLICLLTGTKSTEIGKLIDETYRINFKSLVANLHPQFVNWLEKMVAPNVKNRYPNAASALSSLELAVVINATSPNFIVRNPKLLLKSTAVVLTTLSLITWVSTGLIIYPHKISEINNYKYMQHSEDATRLLTTDKCPSCDLSGVNLSNAKLDDVNLQGADLTDANLEGANLSNANLWGANLTNANLKNAYLAGADLKGAYLNNANLTNANLKNANLWYTKLKSANLKGATMPDGSIHP